MSEKKESLFDWFTRLKRRKHSRTTLESLTEVTNFKILLAKQPCVACGQNGLQLDHFSRCPIGWQADVHCDNCNFRGVVNSEGFDFKEVSSKGKARE
jgi:hypothetical protein